MTETHPAASPPPSAFAETMRTRLRLLIKLRGHSLRSISLQMKPGPSGPRAHCTAWRKLRPDVTTEDRTLSVDEVDEMLSVLGEPADSLFSPVLAPGDVDMLRRIDAAGGSLDADEIPGALKSLSLPRSGPCRPDAMIERLVDQGFLVVATDGGMTLTSEGDALLADVVAPEPAGEEAALTG